MILKAKIIITIIPHHQRLVPPNSLFRRSVAQHIIRVRHTKKSRLALKSITVITQSPSNISSFVEKTALRRRGTETATELPLRHHEGSRAQPSDAERRSGRPGQILLSLSYFISVGTKRNYGVWSGRFLWRNGTEAAGARPIWEVFFRVVCSSRNFSLFALPHTLYVV